MQRHAHSHIHTHTYARMHTYTGISTTMAAQMHALCAKCSVTSHPRHWRLREALMQHELICVHKQQKSWQAWLHGSPLQVCLCVSVCVFVCVCESMCANMFLYLIRVHVHVHVCHSSNGLPLHLNTLFLTNADIHKHNANLSAQYHVRHTATDSSRQAKLPHARRPGADI
jgi:hypothetical protein